MCVCVCVCVLLLLLGALLVISSEGLVGVSGGVMRSAWSVTQSLLLSFYL